MSITSKTAKGRKRIPPLARSRIQLTEGRSQNALRRLSRKLFHLQDDERRRLARELHDTTAQNIAAMIMDLGVIRGSTERLSSEARTALSDCISTARQSLQEIRMFSYLLHPPMIDELGLVSSLRIYVESLAKGSGLQVELDIPDAPTKLPTELEITLFRMVQQGLMNAQRQSGSQRAKVTMRFNATTIRLKVENEMPSGSLLTETGKHRKDEPGFRSMQERVGHSGGHLTFHLDEFRTVLGAIFPLSGGAKRQAAKAIEPRWVRNLSLTQQAS